SPLPVPVLRPASDAEATPPAPAPKVATDAAVATPAKAGAPSSSPQKPAAPPNLELTPTEEAPKAPAQPPPSREQILQKAKLVAPAREATAKTAAPPQVVVPSAEVPTLRETIEPAPPAAAKLGVLFVDDDERILNALRVLFRNDYDVHTATGGAKALEM